MRRRRLRRRLRRRRRRLNVSRVLILNDPPALGRNLNRRKKLQRTQDPMRGNRIASCLVIASVAPAATGRTEPQGQWEQALDRR